MPRFQSGLLLIATSPLLLIQSATLNIDGINFGVPMCMFALVWKMRTAPGSDPGLSLAIVTCLAWWTALLKPTQIVELAVLLFIPQECFRSGRKKAAWLLSTLCMAAGLWLYWNKPYLDVNIAGWFDPSHPPISAQRAWLLQHPGDLLNALGIFFHRDFFPQWKDFYGGVGGWTHKWVLSTVSSFVLSISRSTGSRNIPQCAA